jgi:hypothetical protein
MLFASLVRGVEDDEALGETAPTVEELERFQPNAVVAARQFGSAGRATALDWFLRIEIGVARATVGSPQALGNQTSVEQLRYLTIRLRHTLLRRPFRTTQRHPATDRATVRIFQYNLGIEYRAPLPTAELGVQVDSTVLTMS